MFTVHQRYGRTDRRTNGRTTYDNSTALALRASRGYRAVKTYASVVVDIPQEHGAVAGGRTVEVDDKRVDTVLG